MRILGIDPGLNITGYGILEWGPNGLHVCEAGVVRGTKGKSLAHRVGQIHAGVTDVIESLKPEVMSLEEIYTHIQRPRTSVIMGHARGVICLAATQAGIPVYSYSATQVKKILTGNGRAPKHQMQLATQRELKLTTLPEPDDVADALAIALCHYYLSKDPLLQL